MNGERTGLGKYFEGERSDTTLWSPGSTSVVNAVRLFSKDLALWTDRSVSDEQLFDNGLGVGFRDRRWSCDRAAARGEKGYEVMEGMNKPWPGPLSQICLVLLIVSIMGVAGTAYYVSQQPSVRSDTPAIDFLKGQEMAQNQSKFATEPMSWAVLGFAVVGLSAGVTREWARREKASRP